MKSIFQLITGLFFLLMNTTLLASEVDIFKAAREGDSVAIQQYIQQGGDINMTNEKSYTPFILAAYYGKTQALETLLNLGANACAVDKKNPRSKNVVLIHPGRVKS